MRLIVLFLIIACTTAVYSATPADTQKFLKSMRHSWCPYPLPAETSLQEIEKVASLGFDTVGILFTGPYNNGNMDFEKLDQAIDMIAKRGQKVVLHLAPRFVESDEVRDRLDNGRVLTNMWNKNPNYAIVDIFDRVQRSKCADWFEHVAYRYGNDKRVAAFVIGWGYMGETGFFIGDFLTDFTLIGSECAGYSDYALVEFNKWRVKHKLPRVNNLPMPSVIKQSDDYIIFYRFRSEFVRDVFHTQMIKAIRDHTKAPVGTFAYIAAGVDCYARNWVDCPTADFYRTAGAASSFDMTRTLIDSGVGWEDCELHDGKWNFTAACMERDFARQTARGGVYHAMWVRVYDTEPQWEKGVFDKVSSFLKTQNPAKKIHRPVPTIALYQPTWGVSSLPARSEAQKFLPKVEYANYLKKMIGLTESFGLPYKLITEADLLDSSRLKSYKHIIIPMWDQMPRVIGKSRFDQLSKDSRIVKLPLKEGELTRTQFREALTKAGVKISLDFKSDRVLAGRYANVVYNWDEKPITVKVPEREEEIELKPYEYVILP